MLTKSRQLSCGVVRSVYLVSLQNFPFNQQQALHMKITSLTFSAYQELLQKGSNWGTKRFIFPHLSKNVPATVRSRATGHHVNNGLSHFGWDGRDPVPTDCASYLGEQLSTCPVAERKSAQWKTWKKGPQEVCPCPKVSVITPISTHGTQSNLPGKWQNECLHHIQC